jgi:hypothetical protein
MLDLLLGDSVSDFFNWQTLMMGAAGLAFLYKLLKDAKKPLVALALIGIVGFVALRFMPGQQAEQPQQPGGLFGLMSGLQGLMREPAAQRSGTGNTYRRPLPRRRVAKKGEMPLPNRTYAEMHKPAIDDLERQRFAKIVEPKPKMPPKLVEYLNPERRKKAIQVALAKEIDRRGSTYLLTAEDRERETSVGFASVAPAPSTPRMMKPWEARSQALDLHERRINEVQALSQRIAQKYAQPQPPALVGGLDHERRWR